MPTDQQPIYDEAALAALEDDSTEVGNEFDPDADYAAPPPPVPDDWYQAKLILIGVKDADGQVKEFSGPRTWGNIPSTFFTQIAAEIVQPGGLENGKRTNRMNVTTHPEERRHGASSASLVFRALTGKPLAGVKQGPHMKQVLDALRQETLVWVRTQLEGEASDASKAYNDAKKAGAKGNDLPKRPKTFRGQKAFMENGKVTGRCWDDQSQEWVVGRPEIVDLKPSTFTPPKK